MRDPLSDDTGRFLPHPSDDYEDEMAARLGPEIVEAILSGRPVPDEDAVVSEVRSSLGELRRALARDPSPDVAARHLAAMSVASRSALPAVGRDLLAEQGRSRMREKRSPWRRPVRVAVLGLAAGFVLTGGLAFAGALPDRVQDVVADAATVVGLDLPEGANEAAEHGEEVSDTARNTELSGCEKGMAVAEVATDGQADLPDPCPTEDENEVGVQGNSGSGSGSGARTENGGAGGGSGGTGQAGGVGAGGGGTTGTGGAGGGGGSGGTEQGSGGGSGSGGGGTEGGSGSGSGTGGSGAADDFVPEVPQAP